MRIILLVFICLPIIEMLILIKVGQLVGALPTIALVLLTAAVGYALIKKQGIHTLQRAREKLHRGETPLAEFAEGLFLAVGGALLLTPGFVTDALGFVCLIPGVRSVVVVYLLKHVVRFRTPPQRPTTGGDTIEGEFRREK